MKIFRGLASLGLLAISVTSANIKCQCKTGWTMKTGDNDKFCYKRYLVAKTYKKAKEQCKSMDMVFPKLRNDNELDMYTKITPLKTWVQAEKRAGIWNGWNGIVLNNQDWFNKSKNNAKNEPTKGDVYGYMYYGKVYGAPENALSQYVCEYNIQQQCNAAEKEKAKKQKEMEKEKADNKKAKENAQKQKEKENELKKKQQEKEKEAAQKKKEKEAAQKKKEKEATQKKKEKEAAQKKKEKETAQKKKEKEAAQKKKEKEAAQKKKQQEQAKADKQKQKEKDAKKKS